MAEFGSSWPCCSPRSEGRRQIQKKKTFFWMPSEFLIYLINPNKRAPAAKSAPPFPLPRRSLFTVAEKINKLCSPWSKSGIGHRSSTSLRRTQKDESFSHLQLELSGWTTSLFWKRAIEAKKRKLRLGRRRDTRKRRDLSHPLYRKTGEIKNVLPKKTKKHQRTPQPPSGEGEPIKRMHTSTSGSKWINQRCCLAVVSLHRLTV